MSRPQPKLIECLRLPNGDLAFYINGELLPVVRAQEDYSRAGHTITLTVVTDCIEFRQGDRDFG